MLVDSFGRKITYLRVSVTDKCNFNCIYCSSTKSCPEQVNTVKLEQFLKVIKIFSVLGITRVRLTGGEPFLKDGIVHFISQLRKLNLEVAITTNASLLNEGLIDELSQLGVKKYNISLDTINNEKFYSVTKTNMFKQVLNNIKLLSSKNVELKLNTVLLRGINIDEVTQLIEFAGEHNAVIRFIELMPVGMDTEKLFYPAVEIINKLYADKKIKPYKLNGNYFGPGQYFIYNNKQIIGFITPMSSPFCNNCNRVRITSRLTLRLCLGYNYEVDLKNINSDEEIKLKIYEALRNKPEKYSFDTTIKDCMRSIGG